MNKILSKILISVVMVGILMLPISPSLEKQTTYAQNTKPLDQVLSSSTLAFKNANENSATFNLDIIGDQVDWENVAFIYTWTETILKGLTIANWIANHASYGGTKDIVLQVYDTNNKLAGEYDLTPEIWANTVGQQEGGIPLVQNWLGGTHVFYPPAQMKITRIISGLSPDTSYTAIFKFNGPDQKLHNFGKPQPLSFQTAKDGEVIGDTTENKPDEIIPGFWDFQCVSLSSFSMSGCIANFVYVFYTISAMVAHLAGNFLDFFIYYSTDSDSYSNGFIEKGWGAIRDVANIFFIIALLYVAIKTILGLNVSNNQKIVGYIILIALVINFSLFTTKVVIDGSNILAKIFYNNITPKDGDGKILDPAAGEEKSISRGLVDKFNPQKIVTKKVYDSEGGHGTFIFITILAVGIVLYTAYIFFSVGLLFVARVVSLWIYMIFSPIAFVSYTLPFDIPGFGHKEWWKNLFENAFLAPIFVFLLYIIVMFAGFLSEIVEYPDSADLMQKTMSIVIPFIILMILLKKSKDLAVKYSGEMGAAIIKGAQMVGGLAFGAVTGGAALLGTGVIGGAAARFLGGTGGEALKEKAKQRGMTGFIARSQLKTLNYGAKSTFDVRKTKLGGGLTKVSGMDFQSAELLGLGSKAGGFKGAQERRADKIKKESELYKTTMTDAETMEWSIKTLPQRKADYEKKKEKAIREGMTAEEFEKKNPKPKLYTNSRQLNNDRMDNYIQNIGKMGLLHSMSESIANKMPPIDEKSISSALIKAQNEYSKKEAIADGEGKEKGDAFRKTFAKPDKESVKTQLMDERVRTVKIAIGATAAVASGGTVGGLVGGAVSVAGGGAIGTAGAVGKYLTDEAAEHKAKTGMKKEFEIEKNRLDRIENLKKEKTKLEEELSNLTEEFGVIGSSGKKEINTEELEKTTEKLDKEMGDFKEKMENIVKNIKDINTTMEESELEHTQINTEREKLKKEYDDEVSKGASMNVSNSARIDKGIRDLNKKEQEIIDKKDILKLKLQNFNIEKTDVSNKSIETMKKKKRAESFTSLAERTENKQRSIDSAEGLNAMAKNGTPYSPAAPEPTASKK